MENIKKIKRLYDKGVNIMDHINKEQYENIERERAIEISYDLQAGSYIRSYRSNPEKFENYYQEIGSVLCEYTEEGQSILDCGTGEMTTLYGVISKIGKELGEIYAFDISMSRIDVGREFFGKDIKSRRGVTCFVANMQSIPLPSSSVDVVWTSHAVEPNSNKAGEIIGEIIRVARQKVLLFEPSYERNSKRGRERMDRLGYVKGIPSKIEKRGGSIEKVLEVENALNPLNPTHAYVVDPGETTNKDANNENISFICPITGAPIKDMGGYFFSENSLIAYPVIDGIPLLRDSHGVLATNFHSETE